MFIGAAGSETATSTEGQDGTKRQPQLQPEHWLFEDQQNDKALASLFKRRREPAVDILVWVQCYASLVAVLVEKHVQYAPQFMAYLSTIVRSHRNFEGLGWVAYNIAYRCRAAMQKDLNWSIIDPSLYNLLFTGRARATARCAHCLSQEHSADACPAANGPFFQFLASAYQSQPSSQPPQPPHLPYQQGQSPYHRPLVATHAHMVARAGE